MRNGCRTVARSCATFRCSCSAYDFFPTWPTATPSPISIYRCTERKTPGTGPGAFDTHHDLSADADGQEQLAAVAFQQDGHGLGTAGGRGAEFGQRLHRLAVDAQDDIARPYAGLGRGPIHVFDQ